MEIPRQGLRRDVPRLAVNQAQGRLPRPRSSAKQVEDTVRNTRIFQDFLKGVPIKQIADSIGISTIRVNQIVRRQGRRALPHVGPRIMTAPLCEVRQVLSEEISAAQLEALPKLRGRKG